MRRTYLLSGGPQYSSSANARAGSPAGGSAASPSESARCPSCLRRRVAESEARRRFSLNADGSWRASSPANSTRPSASTVAVSVTRTLIVCPSPSSKAISPTTSGGPPAQISTVRSPFKWSDAETAPVDDDHHLPRIVPLAPEDLTLLHVRRRITRA